MWSLNLLLKLYIYCKKNTTVEHIADKSCLIFLFFFKFVRQMCFMLIDMFTNIRTTHVKQTLHKPCKTCLDTETQYITFFAVFFASFSCTEVLGTEHEDCQAFM